ncbi:MAG: acyltransferase family protein [Ilumatobacter sp.]|uniref:acyltransferase family protein n=1 Tax=Ilumatobacter sp. TaxID=1967498 RepID=UPI0026366CE1|nr:acyltransferase family protein [Ilumatobacter sp.]MDJ0771288.1 acyltransferase family protein [Ilumatobacter sp.]
MTGRTTIAYQPALDGVRALAVVAVLFFHGGVPGFDGGYLGVSVFFTLSGFLITSLLVGEHDATGRIDLPAFYGRRLRRLLPASAICLGAVIVIAAVTDWFGGVAALRDHVIGSVMQVANWVFLAGGGSYQDLLARTNGQSSPLEHFWSLAIEEQFYWIWPPTMLVLLGRARTPRARVRAVGAITAATMLAAPVIAQVWGPDAAYWATPARIGEILVGAFLAVALVGRRVPERWSVLAPAALLVLGIAVVLFPSSSGPAYEGWLPLVAIASGALLLGLQAPGPVRDALSIEPLVALGRISYGVYLFHWPIYVIATPERTGIDGVGLLGVRVLLTLAIAHVSYQLVEQPIRRNPRFSPLPTLGVSAGATAAVVLAAVVAVPGALGDYWLVDDEVEAAAAIVVDDEPLAALVDDVAALERDDQARSLDEAPTVGTADADSGSELAASSESAQPRRVATPPGEPDEAEERDEPAAVVVPETTQPVVDVTIPPLPELGRPVRIVVTGDSTARAIGSGVVAWAAEHPDLAQAEVHGAAGCGFVQGGARTLGGTTEVPSGCVDWTDKLVIPQVERLEPDVVMVMVTAWDVVDQEWDGATLTPLDAPYADRIAADYGTLVDDLLAAGAGRVALVRQPLPDPFWQPGGDAQEDPARHQVVYDAYEALAAGSDGLVAVVPFDRWFADAGLDDDHDVRPDGVHLSPAAATDVTSEFLGERLVRIALGLPAEAS